MKLHSKHLKIGALITLVIAVVTIMWGLARKVPVKLKVEPVTAVVSVDNQTIGPGSRVSFGRKTIEVSNPNYTPYRAIKKVGFLSSLDIAVKLRPLAQAQKIADGDLLRQDGQNKLYYRSGNQIFLAGGSPLSIAQTDFSKLSDIVFSPDGKLAWVRFDDNVNGIFDFSRYNLTNQEIIRWDDGISSVAWLPSASSVDPDRARLIYLKDGVIFKTDPRRTVTERLLDVSSEGIKDAYMEISADEKVMLVEANNNLYLLRLNGLTLNKIASGGVTSATLDSHGAGLAFTQNGKLIYQKFYLPNQFSTDPKDIANIDKILVESPKPLGVSAQAKDGYFSKDDKFFTAISGPNIVTARIENSASLPVYHEPLPDGAGLLKSFNDITVYFAANGAIYSIALDYGVY